MRDKMKEVGQMSPFAQSITEEQVERLIREYGDDVYKVAYLYMKDKVIAEDIFQDVFYKVMKNYASFRQESTEKTWIMRITINTCKDKLRSSWFRRVKLVEQYDDNQEVVVNPVDVIQQERHQQLYQAIYELSPKHKEILILFYFKEYTYEEIGDILSIPLGTVQSRLSRAKSKLKKQLLEGGERSNG